LIKKLFAPYLAYRLRKAFKVLKYNNVKVLPGHSVLLLCNHFSWWDGFFAGHLTHTYLHRDFHIMMQEDHLRKRMFFSRVGGFSINRKSKAVVESLQYTAALLNNPDNLVAVFPQGALESNHTDEIGIERGIDYIVKKIKGDCQIIYYSAFIEYFESLKPSVYFHFLDCGTNHDFDFERAKAMINAHHKKALKEQVNAEH
jgi:hypothetical protein